MPQRDHFSLLAPVYDHFIQPKAPEALEKLLELPVQGGLLDAGGGTGRVAQMLRGSVTQIVVADLSLEMLRQAAAKGGLHPLAARSEQLPFGGEMFARVLMVDALHHVGSQPETIRELWRVLRPGGILVIEEPDIRTWPVKLIAVAEKLALMRSHFLAPQAIAALFPPAAQVSIAAEAYTAWAD